MNFFATVLDEWRKIAEKIAIFQTTVILTGVYVVAVGLVSFMMKLFKADSLRNQLPKRNPSLWHPITIKNDSLEHCRRQF